jgi:2-polyprenyl-3-methyl-5-hydroxy-6-metoxy-1,4-benzoquinol methylase
MVMHFQGRSTDEYYDKFGDAYIADRQSERCLFNDHLEKPVIIKLVNSMKKIGKVLDIGCGPGIYSALLADSGASVTAIDSSEKMISAAKKWCGNRDVKFFKSSFEDYFDENEYDLVLGSFMLGYWANLFSIFNKVKNLLSKNGVVLISGLHPTYMSCERKADGKYIMCDYFSKNEYVSGFLSRSEPMRLKRWNFQDISRAAKEAGLFISEMFEPKISKNKKIFLKKNKHLNRTCPAIIIIILERRFLTIR